MITIDHISQLRLQLTPFMIAPGSIFRVPVQHLMPFPTIFLERLDQSERLSTSYQSRITVGDVWLNEETGNFEVPAQDHEIILQAKVRPFLLIRPLKVCDVEHYIGLPISSVKDWMRENQRMYGRMENNQHWRFYLLPETIVGELRLYKESYVIIASPILIRNEYLTDYLGTFNDFNNEGLRRHFSRIRKKLRAFFYWQPKR